MADSRKKVLIQKSRATHPNDDVPGLVRDMRGEGEVHPADALVGVGVGLGLEGRLATQELVAQDPQGPQIHGLIVSLAFHHLWGQVVQRATQCCPSGGGGGGDNF